MKKSSVYDLQLKNCSCMVLVEYAETKSQLALVLIKLVAGEIAREDLKPKFQHYLWQLKLGGAVFLELPDSKARDEVQFDKWVRSIFEHVAELSLTDSPATEKFVLPRNFLGDTDSLQPVDFETGDLSIELNDTNSFPDESAEDTFESKKSSQLNYAIPNQPDYAVLDVFYAINREIEQQGDTFKLTAKRGSQNYYGSCQVSIPEKHVLGEIERPSWWKKLVGVKLSPKKHMMLLDNQLINFDDLLTQLKNQQYSSTDILLFVHGYNVEFEEAILRTAQLSWDLNFPGASMSYVWPSQGNIQGYFADEAAAEYTRPYFTDFLTQLLHKTGTAQLYIIAHSMGSRIVSRALEKLNDSGIQYGDRIQQLIFAAPDIDAAIFREQIAPAFKQLKQITLYASAKDKALMLSEFVRYDYPRAGQGGDNICVIAGIDTIDASDVNTDFLGHGYFAATGALINDIYSVISNGLRPDKRLLREVIKGDTKYWMFAKQ